MKTMPINLAKASVSLGAIAACLAISPAALAQTAPGDTVEELLVTATRISGFTAPTPTTIVGAADLTRTAAPSLADVLNKLPSFQGAGPTAQGVGTANPGANYLNLRNLGDNRTLVLVDGRRHVATSDRGTVDINVIPSALVQRVDIVTGGASAAYGSDAVAGVVNLILDKTFTGLKGSLQGGVTQRGDDRSYRVTAAWGANLLDDRGHFMIAGEYTRLFDTPYYGDRAWGRNNYQLLSNAAGQAPARLLLSNVRYSNMTYGGLINAGPLKGTQFLPAGQTRAFQYGTLVGANFMSGGDGDTLLNDVVLDVPAERGNLFARFDYEIAPSLTATFEGSHAESKTMATTVAPFDTAIAIQRDNAYLPTSVRDRMVAASLATVSVGRLNRDLGLIHNGGHTKTDRLVASLAGELPGGWKWDGYVQWGQTDYLQTQPNDRNNVLWLQAVDAVVNPANGQVVCRGTLSTVAATRAANEGCVPVNIFGDGSMNPTGVARFMGTAWFRSLITQWAGGANVSGEPFSTWAGPVGVAAGLEFRKDELKTTSDATSLARAWRIGNFQPLSGQYDVKEGYVEIGVPLLRDQILAKDLSLNMAGRATDYSLSGTVKTWKLGGAWAVNDQIQLRATKSRDIRAPNLGELYQAGNQLSGGITDRLLPNNPQYTVANFTGGNPNLTPERATTRAYGVVLSPAATPGLRLSVDYFDITIADAIVAISGQATIDRCLQGATNICGNITRNPATGLITQIRSTYINAASRRQSGYDIEAAYAVPMGDVFDGFQGDLALRLLATNTLRYRINDGVVTTQGAGQVNTPKWKVNGKVTYTNGGLTLFAEERWIDSTVYDRAFTANDIARNKIDSTHYTTVSGAYDFTVAGDRKLTGFLVVDNLFDRDPEIVGSTGFTSQTAPATFDVLGRRFTLGLRFAY